jgi:hypothetical protein
MGNRPSDSSPDVDVPGPPRFIDGLLTVDEVAAIARTTVPMIYYWRSTTGQPRGMRLGKHLLFWPPDVEKWLKSRLDPPAKMERAKQTRKAE